MFTASSVTEIPANAVAAFAKPGGEYVVYMPGDTLPPAPPPGPPPVPSEVPARLALRLLLRDKWFGPSVTTPDQLDAAVAGFLAQSIADAGARNAALLDWRRSAVFQFSNPTIRAALSALGKTVADLAALMTEADAIRRQEEGL